MRDRAGRALGVDEHAGGKTRAEAVSQELVEVALDPEFGPFVLSVANEKAPLPLPEREVGLERDLPALVEWQSRLSAPEVARWHMSRERLVKEVLVDAPHVEEQSRRRP